MQESMHGMIKSKGRVCQPILADDLLAIVYANESFTSLLAFKMEEVFTVSRVISIRNSNI